MLFCLATDDGIAILCHSSLYDTSSRRTTPTMGTIPTSESVRLSEASLKPLNAEITFKPFESTNRAQVRSYFVIASLAQYNDCSPPNLTTDTTQQWR